MANANQKAAAIKRQFQGEVVSVAEDKTIHVRIARSVLHPKYQKQYTVHKKMAAHDERNQANVGDIVLIEECRPLSKTKRTRLVSIIKPSAN
jgi:small subunit ribosomal protein S17